MKRGALLVVSLLTATTLTGCAQDPEIHLNWFEIDSTKVTACEKLVTSLPETLIGESRWTLASDEFDEQHHERLGAAWGDPIITLKCAVKYPDSNKDIEVEAGGISWTGSIVTSGYRYNSVGLTQHVQVTIPEVYEAQTVLTELAPYISGN